MAESQRGNLAGDTAESEAANIAHNTARWCIRLIRNVLVLADAPAGLAEDLTCRTAIFENVKGYGFRQEVAEPLVAAVATLPECRNVIGHFDGEPDRPTIADIDAFALNWHDLAFCVVEDLSNSINLILQRGATIDYGSASEDELRAFSLMMEARCILSDWFDVMFYLAKRWRYRNLPLLRIEDGLIRELLRSRERKSMTATVNPGSAATQHLDGPEDPHWFLFNNTCHQIGTNRKKQSYALLKYFWNRSSATFEELVGHGRPWKDAVTDNAFAVAVTRFNREMPRGFPWKLKTDGRCVLKELLTIT